MSYVHIGLYNALRELGATEDTARAAVADMPVPEHLATKEDLLKAIASLEGKLTDLRGEIKASFAVLKYAYGPIIITLLVKIAFFD